MTCTLTKNQILALYKLVSADLYKMAASSLEGKGFDAKAYTKTIN